MLFPQRRDSKYLVVLIWALICTIFIASHFGFYFREAHSELGDFAANALQIRNAKSFTELYGNYSRWGFHHPGPAFFYLYALGEWLLHDLTRIVPSPYNAHAVIGVLIQSCFFVWSLAILRRHIRRPLIGPLLLFLAGAHFAAVNYNVPDSAFDSIWPPHVLLFPFLCLLIASASVAAGSFDDLIPLVVSAGFLVHGHIAQPLFVLTFALVAGLGLLFSFRRHNLLSHSSRGRTLVIASSIIALFLLPLLIDLSRGNASNAHAVLDYMRKHSGDRKTLSESLVYFVSFFCYVAQPEKYCAAPFPQNLSFLWHRWPFTIFWVAVIVWLVAKAKFICRESRFACSLLILVCLGCLLTIFWGTHQTGEMFNFNSYFNFALLFAALILAAIAASPSERTSAKTLSIFLYSLSFPLFIFAARSGRLGGDEFTAVAPHTLEPIAAAAHEHPEPTFLLFQHEDWPWAVGVALELARNNVRHVVTKEWGIIFGDDHVGQLDDFVTQGGEAIWRMSPPEEYGSIVLTGGPRIAIAPRLLDPTTNPRLEFRNSESAYPYAISGWDLSNGAFSWSDGDVGLLLFRAAHATRDVSITVDCFPARLTKGPARMTIDFCGVLLREVVADQPVRIIVTIPADLWNAARIGVLSFHFPDAASPSGLGISPDPRRLSYGFTEVSFDPLPADSESRSE